jgi:hypothetical protein
MNVLYIGVENPIKIAIANYPCNKIIVKPTYGYIIPTAKNCHFIYKIDSCNINKERIFFGIINNGTIKWLDSVEYRVKKTPDPEIIIDNNLNWIGPVTKNNLINSKIIAKIFDFDFECYSEVVNYSIEIRRNDTLLFRETNINGNKFTEKLNSEILKSQKGDHFIFFDILIKSSQDKCIRELKSKEFKIK